MKKDIESIQSKNLSQQQRVFNNSASSQGPANTAADLIARDQWNRLAQAQELAVTRVRPLRVNLPINGLHQAFTQVLQTEIGKPLTIQFTAANIQSGSLLRQFLGGALALLALWAIVATLLARPNKSSIPS